MHSHAHADGAQAPTTGGILKPALVGVLLALPTIPLMFLLTDIAVDLIALLLAATAGVYVGFGVSDGRPSVVWRELGLAFVTFACAALGLWGPSWWLALGYFIHGVWDLLHHAKRVKSTVRYYYPPFCAALDWVVALIILVLR